MNRNSRIADAVLFTLALGLPIFAWTMHAQSPPVALRVGDHLPDVAGQNLSGTPTHLSTVVGGKIAVVVFSFSKSGGKDTQIWDRQLVGDFGSSPSVALSTVIYLESAPRLLRGVIVSGVKNSIPPPLHTSTIVTYENEELWKQHLNVADDSRAYVVLLGRDRRIRWVNSGDFSDAEYKQLKDQIEKQL